MNTRTTIEIDEELLSAARKALGTTSIKETIEAALVEVLRAHARREEVVALSGLSGGGLANDEVMKQAWRP